MNSFLKVAAVVCCMSVVGASCDKKETKPQEENTNTEATVPLSGAYTWSFSIPGMGEQLSTLVFYPDSVEYAMSGSAFTTDYMMMKSSYTNAGNELRWIGVGKGGSIPKDDVYFVMFFKEITETSVTIYKHECDLGKEEAEAFAYPPADATADHGWNVYHKQ